MRNDSIDISVVMPVYNCEDYVGEAIESILNQSFENFEFIIVCEYGANENTKDIIKHYAMADSRIIIVENKEQLGVSKSLNAGIKIAMGEYIARMDSDDVSSERRLEIQKLYMDTYTDIGLCGIRHRVIGDSNWIVDYSANPAYLECDLLFMSPLRHPSLMMRKRIIHEYDLFYDEKLEGVEDYELYIRASKYTKLSNILEDNLFYHRRSTTNLSLVYRERDNEIQTNILRDLYKDKFEIVFCDADIKRLSAVTFLNGQACSQYISELEKLNCLLVEIENANNKLHVYDSASLENAFYHRWMRARYKLKSLYNGCIPNAVLSEWRKGKYYKKWMN